MIVFVIAMESEAQPLLSKMEEIKENTVHGRKVISGKLNGQNTAAIVCGVGKVNAAAGTQYAIDCLGATKIVNFGVAGGLNASTELGGIYCIDSVVQYDFDLVQLNSTPIGTLNEFDQPYLKLAAVPAYPLRKLATGDRFNDDKSDFLLLTETLNADIRDMECGAIAHVCRHAGIPCYSFKAISDVAGAESTTVQFAINLAMCTFNLQRNIIYIFEAVNG